MYHTFVRRQIRRADGLINADRLDALAAQFAADAVLASRVSTRSGESSAGRTLCVPGLRRSGGCSRTSAWSPGASSVGGRSSAYACGHVVRRLRHVP